MHLMLAAVSPPLGARQTCPCAIYSCSRYAPAFCSPALLQAMLQRPAPLTAQGVLATLRGLALEKGQGAAGRRQRTVLGLLRACREAETKYLTRTLVQVRAQQQVACSSRWLKLQG
jgi:ATP-dependent DNA ligase